MEMEGSRGQKPEQEVGDLNVADILNVGLQGEGPKVVFAMELDVEKTSDEQLDALGAEIGRMLKHAKSLDSNFPQHNPTE